MPVTSDIDIPEYAVRMMTVRYMMAQRGITMRQIGEHLGRNHRSLTRALRLSGVKEDDDGTRTDDSNKLTTPALNRMLDSIEDAITALSTDVYEMSGLENEDRAIDWWSELRETTHHSSLQELMEEP